MPHTPPQERPDARATDPDAGTAPPDTQQRKPFVRPELTRHGSLPEVTGSFIGTFSP